MSSAATYKRTATNGERQPKHQQRYDPSRPRSSAPPPPSISQDKDNASQQYSTPQLQPNASQPPYTPSLANYSVSQQRYPTQQTQAPQVTSQPPYIYQSSQSGVSRQLYNTQQSSYTQSSASYDEIAAQYSKLSLAQSQHPTTQSQYAPLDPQYSESRQSAPPRQDRTQQQYTTIQPHFTRPQAQNPMPQQSTMAQQDHIRQQYFAVDQPQPSHFSTFQTSNVAQQRDDTQRYNGQQQTSPSAGYKATWEWKVQIGPFTIIIRFSYDPVQHVAGNDLLDTRMTASAMLSCAIEKGTFSPAELIRTSEEYEKQDPSFFSVGRVFAVPFPDFATTTGLKHGSRSAPDERLEQTFIVIEAGQRYCYVLPVSTYGGYGVGREGAIAEEHAILHTSKKAPSILPGEVPRRGQSGLYPYALRIVPETKSERLDDASRANLSELWVFMSDVPARSIGKIHKDFEAHLNYAFRSVWSKKFRIGSLQSRNVATQERMEHVGPLTEQSTNSPNGPSYQRAKTASISRQHYPQPPSNGRPSSERSVDDDNDDEDDDDDDEDEDEDEDDGERMGQKDPKYHREQDRRLQEQRKSQDQERRRGVR